MTVTVAHDHADAAFRSLYAEHGPALLRLSTVLTGGDWHRAEDIVQETMLRAWTHRANLDIQHHSPFPWLITVARHLAVDAHGPGKAAQQRPSWTTILPSPAASSPTPASTRSASAPQSPICPVRSARY